MALRLDHLDVAGNAPTAGMPSPRLSRLPQGPPNIAGDHLDQHNTAGWNDSRCSPTGRGNFTRPAESLLQLPPMPAQLSLRARLQHFQPTLAGQAPVTGAKAAGLAGENAELHSRRPNDFKAIGPGLLPSLRTRTGALALMNLAGEIEAIDDNSSISRTSLNSGGWRDSVDQTT